MTFNMKNGQSVGLHQPHYRLRGRPCNSSVINEKSYLSSFNNEKSSVLCQQFSFPGSRNTYFQHPQGD